MVRLRLHLASSHLVSSRRPREEGKGNLPSKGCGPVGTVNPQFKKYRAADGPPTTGHGDLGLGTGGLGPMVMTMIRISAIPAS